VWLDSTLGIRDDPASYFSRDSYDFRIFDNPRVLHDEIIRKNALNNKSRILAGYCWDWISKSNRKKPDIVFPEFGYQARWNLHSHGSAWIIQANSVSEVGCIHTSQGLEVDYVGVIVGPDLLVRDGRLVTNPGARARTDKSLHGFKKALRETPAAAESKADAIIRNTYRTLMSRGIKGCYVYFTDAATATYFSARLPST
jgi:DUF2075 family protein